MPTLVANAMVPSALVGTKLFVRFWGVIGDMSGIKRKEKAAAGGSGSVPVGSGDHPLREHEAACKAEMVRAAAATTDATALERHLAKHEAELLAARSSRVSTKR